jgi:WD40 repeat protein/serine/threonine protein kinase
MRLIDELLQQALDLEPGERAAFLERACGEDSGLRRDVRRLLNREDEARGFIESPAIARCAQELAGPSPAELVGQRIGHYRIEALIGAGGMGDVYRAYDENLQRVVALKMLPAEFTRDAERVWRFEQEAFAASRLSHPNIVTIFEIIHAGDAHFIAAEYVEGQTLRELLTDPQTGQPRRLNVERAIDIAIQVASALRAAHTAWIIHRDIKPENIMARKDGLVKILDFGIAKLTGLRIADCGLRIEEADCGLRIEEVETLIQDPQASPQRRNPQSAIRNPQLTDPGAVMGTASYMSPEQARGEQLDGRTDLFSLGVVFYEMVAGERLFAGVARLAMWQSRRSIEEPRPSEVRFDHVPKGLQRIIRRMLRRDRNERYASAGELLDDLNRLKRRVENRTARRVIGASALAVVAAMTLAAFAAFLSLNEVWEERLLRDGHTAAARRAVFSPDGRMLISGGEDNRVIVWDFARRERLKTLADHKGWVTALAFSPDGKWFASAGADGAVIVWDAAQLKKVAVLPSHQGVVRNIAFSADGRFLVTPTGGDEKNVWAVGRWEKERTIVTRGLHQAFFLLSPDGRGLVTPTWAVFDLETGQHLGSGARDNPSWAMAALSPDAAHLVSAGSGGAVAFWEMNSFWTSLRPRLLSYQRPHQDHGRAAAWSSDGRLAASGAEDIILWDAVKLTKIARLKYPANVMGLAFSPDSRHLVSTHADGAILLWDAAERELQASFNEHSDSIRSVAFSPDGARVASGSADRSVIIWNQAACSYGCKQMVLEGHQRRVTAVAFSAGGGELASCDMDGNVIVWDLAERGPRLNFPSPRKAEDRASYCLALSPDGRWLATSFGVYDLAQRRLLFDYPANEDGTYRQVYGIDFSSDGRRMVCVTTQGEALLWDVAQWKLIASRRLQKSNLVSVSFSPDGRWLATGEDQGAVRLWETDPLREKSVIGRHAARVKSVAFSPACSAGSCEVASAGEDQVVALWDANRRKLITRIGSHASPVYAIAFSPDGKQLVSGEHDRSVRLCARRRTLWGWRLE